MALKTDRKTLTTELKNAAKKGRNFVYAPSGDKAKLAVLKLSKKKIPMGERSSAKSDAGASKVYYGSCIKKDGVFIFQCAIKPPGSLGKIIKKSIKALTDYLPPTVEAVHMADFVELDFEEDDLQKRAAARRKSVTAAAKWLNTAKPKGYAAITKVIQEANNKFDGKKWKDAITLYDNVLSAVSAARKAASKTKTGEPEPDALKRKKLGAEYADEDKKVGWRAPELTDNEVNDKAALKLVHQSEAFKAMSAAEFSALVKKKHPEITKMIGALKDALLRGDKVTVEKLSKMKIKVKEDRQKFRESDQVTTKYYTEKQRKKHGLKIKDGMLYDSEGNVFDKRRGFVLDPETGNIVIFDPKKVGETTDGKKKTTHHSSPLAGGDVGGAGGIKTDKKGRLDSIDDASGHYKPDASFTLQTLKQLEKLGAKLVDDTIVDEDGDEVSENKAIKYKLVKEYEQERKTQLKKLLTHWKSEVEQGNVKKGKPPKLPPYDPKIAAMRDKLLKAGVGPSQKSTKVRLQGKKGLSQEQFNESKGDVKAVNKILEELTGKKNVLPKKVPAGTLNSRPSLNILIGKLMRRELTKEQFEQTGGNEDQLRKKDKLNEELKTKGRKSALVFAMRELGASSVLAGAGKILGVKKERLEILSQKLLEETLLGADKNRVLKKLKSLEKKAAEEIEERNDLESEVLEKLKLNPTDAGIKKKIKELSNYDLENIIDGATKTWKALELLGKGAE